MKYPKRFFFPLIYNILSFVRYIILLLFFFFFFIDLGIDWKICVRVPSEVLELLSNTPYYYTRSALRPVCFYIGTIVYYNIYTMVILFVPACTRDNLERRKDSHGEEPRVVEERQ